MRPTASWLRDVRKLTLLYVVAGLALAPWGTVYALLRVWAGWTHPVVGLILLACGAVTAAGVWRRLERLLAERGVNEIRVLIADPVTITDYAGATATGSEEDDFVAGAFTIPQIIKVAPPEIEARETHAPSPFVDKFEPMARSSFSERNQAVLVEA